MAYNHLDPGLELEVSEHIYFQYTTNSVMPELVKLSLEELKQMEDSSVEQENHITVQSTSNNPSLYISCPM